MIRLLRWLALPALLGAALCVPARAAQPSSELGTYLGVLFMPSPTGSGVVVSLVLPDSPAAKADLRRDDVLLRYDREAIRDCQHLVRLISEDQPGRKVRLTVRRDGRDITPEVTLTRGPALRYAAEERSEPPREGPGVAKPGGPAPVSVSAEPLGQGKMRVTVEYYDPRSARYRKVVGDLDDMPMKCRDLPEREQRLAGVAIQQLRALNADPTSGRRTPR